MLKGFGPNIWIADGPTVTAAAGFRYPTRMVVIRLSNSELLLWSPTAATKDLRTAVEALGTVRYLISPNSLHHTFLGDWQQAYPDATVYAPPGLREKRKDIRPDAAIGNTPIAAWAGEIDHAIMWGNRITTEVVFFHRQSGTAIFTDLIQQFPRGWFEGWRALVARLDLMTAAEPTVPRKFRVAWTDRHAARESLRRILAWPTEKVIIAHGPPVTDDGQAFLRRAFRWLAD
ncbi:DUF4336 domain-containing protein [Nitratireductor aquimarinus]|uniref:DUF4336 domain-containing protein n=1 Tax=Alphaproteobacteria TaxID=28211 RepID=UPI0019D3F914|nr:MULTISPECIES: DUF4336 domain-containing protein [Alphaproteobacteria]MBN7757058.1 DUF4336 domain-containing protein [Nitratireductor aquimarinus]MBY5999818.1 DUF4336 domain-containing protein [Tritonibacter mobilis]MBY6021845.1 DUF4336 domain-containing protein [Nitratireductor sp. DP7N14-4]